MKKKDLTRREFIRTAATLSLGIGAAGYLKDLRFPWNQGIAGPLPDMVVGKGANYVKLASSTINALGGMKRFVSRGDIVLLKPNIGWDRLPEQAANTNPDVVSALIKLCLDAGAKKVKVVDNTCNEARRCYVRSGIKDAVEKAGGEISFIDTRKFKEVKIGGEILKNWLVYQDALECDKIINVPIAKHHSLSRLTMSMKNWMGLLGGERNKLHQNIDVCLADLSLFFKPSLTVIDATRILTGNGPQGGNFSDVKKTDTLIAGIDQVALDSYGAALFGMKGSELGYLREAEKRGVGTTNFEKLNLKKINV